VRALKISSILRFFRRFISIPASFFFFNGFSKFRFGRMKED
jgi:hypothetical protein